MWSRFIPQLQKHYAYIQTYKHTVAYALPGQKDRIGFAGAIARCPEELDVDGGTTPACMLLEPVGRSLADRLSHMVAEPLAPQEQVCCFAHAAGKPR